MHTVAVVLAGGTGRRFGAGLPKQMRLLDGRSLVARCVETFAAAPAVDEVLVVAAAELADEIREQLAGVGKLAGVITGGAGRPDSTQRAISWLSGRSAGEVKVLLHDAARPLIDQRTISACVQALDSRQAVGVVVPSPDTIVELADGAFRRILPRDALARCQTPQGFLLSVIARAYELASADPDFAASPPTDDCGVVLRYLPDVPVGAVPGSERNLKITYAADLAIAEALLTLGDPAD
jgi:2-C-methyl-D-erythritol 4-phosphate cytidylyltransferase